MRDTLEHLLRSADVPNQERAQLLWEDYRSGADSPDPARKAAADLAFATLLAWYGQAVYRRVWGFVRSDAAEDVFQEVLAELHQHRGRLPTFADAHRWLRAAADRRSKDALRKLARQKAREAKAARPENDSSDGTVRNQTELQQALALALSKLTREQQQAVALHYFEGLDRQGAAAAMGVNRDTLAARLNAALTRLQKLVPVPATLAAGGTLGVSAAIAARPPTLPATRLDELAAGAWKSAAPAWSVGKVAAAVLLGLTLGGATAGWALTREPERTAAPPPREPESLQAKHLRIFNAEVRPKVAAAVGGLALGEGGSAEVTDVRAFDTRIECRALLRHGPPFDFETKLTILYDAAAGGPHFRQDFRSNGNWRPLDPRQPMYWDNPLTGKRIILRFKELDQIVAAFGSVSWDDPRLREEAADRLEDLRRAARSYEGVWYEAGDAAKPVRARFDPLDGDPLLFTLADGGKSGVGLIDLKVGPDGRLRGVTFHHAEGVLSPDGRRLDFPGTGEWWTREPTRRGS